MLDNGGLMPQSPLERLRVDVNITGVLFGIAAALPHMKRQQAGHIFNVSSVAGHKVSPGTTVISRARSPRS